MSKIADYRELREFQANKARIADELENRRLQVVELDLNWQKLSAGGEDLATNLMNAAKLLQQVGLLPRVAYLIECLESDTLPLPEFLSDYVHGLSRQEQRNVLGAIAIAAKSIHQASKLNHGKLSTLLDSEAYRPFRDQEVLGADALTCVWHPLKISIRQDLLPGPCDETVQNLWKLAESERKTPKLLESSRITSYDTESPLTATKQEIARLFMQCNGDHPKHPNADHVARTLREANCPFESAGSHANSRKIYSLNEALMIIKKNKPDWKLIDEK